MELLTKLYKISSPSSDEGEMLQFLATWLEERNIKYEQGSWGIYATKGSSDTYPCIVAHVDEVHSKNTRKEVIIHKDLIFGYDSTKHATTGIGADDKNGIWVALQLLETEDVVKAAFFVSEEIGCIGSTNAPMGFFDNCRFVIQCDRKGGNDFISCAGGTELCSKKFYKACKPQQFGYTKTTGLITDVMELKDRGLGVSACNISCGYYNPHSDSECTVFPELENCLMFVQWIFKNVTGVFKHTYKQKKYTFSSYYRSGGYKTGSYMSPYYDYYGDYDWEDYPNNSKTDDDPFSEDYDTRYNNAEYFIINNGKYDESRYDLWLSYTNYYKASQRISMEDFLALCQSYGL